MDGGDGAYFANAGDGAHAVGTLAPIIEGYIGLHRDQSDGGRYLARAVRDPLAQRKPD
jgi:hypothetical protein